MDRLSVLRRENWRESLTKKRCRPRAQDIKPASSQESFGETKVAAISRPKSASMADSPPPFRHRSTAFRDGDRSGRCPEEAASAPPSRESRSAPTSRRPHRFGVADDRGRIRPTIRKSRHLGHADRLLTGGHGGDSAAAGNVLTPTQLLACDRLPNSPMFARGGALAIAAGT